MNGGEGSNVDPALLDLFRAEMDTHVPVLSDGLLALEKGRAGETEIAAMMRAAHSIKGAARIVGLEAAVRVAHVMEDCFTAAKERRITLSSDVVDVLLQGVDTLQRICGSEPDPELTPEAIDAVHERIAAVRDGRAPAPTPPPITPEPPEVVQPLIRPQPVAERRIALPVSFDDAAAEDVRHALCTALNDGAPKIRLDFAQVERLSAGALALLAALVCDVARTDPAPALAATGAKGAVATLLRVAGLDRAWTAGD